MASTSPNIVLGGSDGAGKPTTATSSGVSQGFHIYHNNSIDRFLADRGQRIPVGFGSAQTQNEAKAAEEARMFENLRSFDVQFGCDNSLGDEFAQDKKSNDK
ncbi:hypothetical protein FP744_10003149 [Trichoderma asperellum]|nr:hypothetical protein LI328DRAFT_167411 [Trichoderma asperelloides]